jgi:hypothetical protein
MTTREPVLTMSHLDVIVRRHSAFNSFADLLNAAGGYRPTVRCYDERCHNAVDRAELLILADAYDAHQAARGDARRAFRGSQYVPPVQDEEEIEVVAAPAPAPVAPRLTREDRELARKQARDAKFAKLTGPDATWVTMAEAAQMLARECKRFAEKHHGGHIASREVQLLATNGRNERVGDPIDFIIPSRITGKWLRVGALALLNRYPEATTVSFDGGVDHYETFADKLHGGDYTPMVETWDLDVPAHLIASIR